MARPSTAVRIAKWGSIPAGLTLSALLIWQASYAAFSDTTGNPTSNWDAGSVAISDDDEGTALFAADNLNPGDSGEQCITTTYTGSLDAAVALYALGAATTGDLDEQISLVVTAGSGGEFGSCEDFVPVESEFDVFTGTLADFAADHTSFATGLPLGLVTSESAPTSYRFSYTFAADAPNTAQGGTADLGFVWEAQSASAN